jgi:hypothetical protein
MAASVGTAIIATKRTQSLRAMEANPTGATSPTCKQALAGSEPFVNLTVHCVHRRHEVLVLRLRAAGADRDKLLILVVIHAAAVPARVYHSPSAAQINNARR